VADRAAASHGSSEPASEVNALGGQDAAAEGNPGTGPAHQLCSQLPERVSECAPASSEQGPHAPPGQATASAAGNSEGCAEAGRAEGGSGHAGSEAARAEAAAAAGFSTDAQRGGTCGAAGGPAAAATVVAALLAAKVRLDHQRDAISVHVLSQQAPSQVTGSHPTATHTTHHQAA